MFYLLSAMGTEEELALDRCTAEMKHTLAMVNMNLEGLLKMWHDIHGQVIYFTGGDHYALALRVAVWGRTE